VLAVNASFRRRRQLLYDQTQLRKEKSMRIDRFYTTQGGDPLDSVDWVRRDATIKGEDGTTHFHQPGVEVPSSWSQTATNVVAQKYFRGQLGTCERDWSVRQLIRRVANTITIWGEDQGYFNTVECMNTFYAELKYLLVHQMLAFNSPVWFNVGVEDDPQCSACFINSVEDTMDSILTLAKTEGMLFKYGSGTGTNFSPLRSSMEQLHGGGTASGPVSFMKGFDAFAGAIKSGGKTRRAAKMVILNVDHPDIVEFINCKMKEEKKAHALIDAGYDGAFTGEAYGSVFFQNSNNSVRVTDEFIDTVKKNKDWDLRDRNGKPIAWLPARTLWRFIAEAAWACGDPGLQFDTAINDWHTCSNTARINASNPCSEYMFLDDSACNLASLNLLKFLKDDDEFDIAAFQHAVRIAIIAQDILVDKASYPTPRIAENSQKYRPLGLGYANLGALLMTLGLAYDSEDGRRYAASVTALMTGTAYLVSAELAEGRGSFAGFANNMQPFMAVMRKHRHRLAVIDIDSRSTADEICQAASRAWDLVVESAGFRNAQVTVLAPTGTIGFMMDCDTTGIEPDIALVKYKRMVGGGTIKMVNQSVASALKRLGYTETPIQEILSWLEKHDTVENAPGLLDKHLPVFDCAFRETASAQFRGLGTFT
jgi:ribonucleoside-diphosphate reductase alpha chain